MENKSWSVLSQKIIDQFVEQAKVTDQGLMAVLGHIATAWHRAGIRRIVWNVLDYCVPEMSVTEMVEKDGAL